MAVFLKLHADIIKGYWGVGAAERESLKLLHNALRLWNVEQQREAKRLAELVGYCRGIVSFLRAI
jgi:U3 small nucleolar RNA-associated protein 21